MAFSMNPLRIFAGQAIVRQDVKTVRRRYSRPVRFLRRWALIRWLMKMSFFDGILFIVLCGMVLAIVLMLMFAGVMVINSLRRGPVPQAQAVVIQPRSV